MYGPLPSTPDGNSYIFTAVDVFTKCFQAFPLKNKDAVTVATSLFKLFSMFGVCNILISDNGSEFTAKFTKEICRLLDIPQQFTPSFVHHCLGACVRTHYTLATKLTPCMHTNFRNWDIWYYRR